MSLSKEEKNVIINSIYNSIDGFVFVSHDREYKTTFQQGNSYFITNKTSSQRPTYKYLNIYCGIYENTRTEETIVDHYDSIYTIYTFYHTFSNIINMETGQSEDPSTVEYCSDSFIFAEFKPKFLNKLGSFINQTWEEEYVLK
jgi:hypothetical protein